MAPSSRVDLAARRTVADRLHSASLHLLRTVRRRDVVLGLAPAQGSALSILVFGGEKTLTELAAAEQVRPPTMSRIVRELTAKGLVTRNSETSDRRVVQLRATAKGRRLLQEGRRRRVETIAEALRTFDREQLQTLRAAAELMEQIASIHWVPYPPSSPEVR